MKKDGNMAESNKIKLQKLTLKKWSNMNYLAKSSNNHKGVQ